MPISDPEPPAAPPPTCPPCTYRDHDDCETTAIDTSGQLQPCSCPCGGGGSAWTA